MKNLYSMKKRWISAALAAVMVFAMYAGAAEHVSAAAKKPAFISKKFVVFEGVEVESSEDGDSVYYDVAYLGIKNQFANAQDIDDVSCSNEDVCYCGSDFLGFASDGLDCIPRKAGSCKITYKLNPGKKTYTLRTTVKVKKPTKKNLPFSYIKVDGKNIYEKGYYNSCDLTTDDNSAKINYKLNKGWKLKSMYMHTHYEELEKVYEEEAEKEEWEYVEKKTSDRKVKNGKKIELRAGLRQWYTDVCIDVVNKSGEMCHYVISFHDENYYGEE